MSTEDSNRKPIVQEDKKGKMTSIDKTKKIPLGRSTSPFTADGDLVWTVENEVLFLTAMIGHKPVGINRHFEMVCIVDNFQNALNRQVDPQVLWDRLDTMYNMDRLNKVERLPFPNEEIDFSLPEEYSPLIQAKQQDIDLKIEVTPPPEVVVESPKRELKRELQVYKGMKDIRREANKEPSKEATKPEPAPEVKEKEKEKEKKKDEAESTEVTPQKKVHQITTPEKIDRRTKEYKLLEAVKQQILAKDKKSNPERDAKVTPTPMAKSRHSTSKKDVKEEKVVELKKERVKELTPGSAKRSTRGSATDSVSNKSASPITTPATKRKRTQP